MSPIMHPQAMERLRRIADSGEPPLETLTPADARRIADARVAANGLPAPDLHEVQDLVAPGPAGPIPLRLYRATPEIAAPLIMFFHGGGFMLAGLETHDGLCRTIADLTGATVLAVDYRLAPEHRFPAAPDDCLAATRWVLSNAAQLNVDVQSWALMGESAGGNLATGVAQALKLSKQPPKLQVLIYPALDMRTDHPSYEQFGEGFFFTRSKAQYFIDHYLTRPEDADDPRAAPLREPDLAGQCPALIIAAGLDPLLSEAQLYGARLRAAGVDVRSHVFEGWPHGFLFWGESDAARETLALSSAALRDSLDPSRRPAPKNATRTGEMG